MQKLLWALCLLLLTNNVFASEEGVLELSSFNLESNGIGSSGPVVISGQKNDKGEFISLKINAFSKEYAITDEDLKKIPATFFNGLQLSYEHGYEKLGGKTIYLLLQTGFTSGTTKKTLLTLKENGAFNVTELNN